MCGLRCQSCVCCGYLGFQLLLLVFCLKNNNKLLYIFHANCTTLLYCSGNLEARKRLAKALAHFARFCRLRLGVLFRWRSALAQNTPKDVEHHWYFVSFFLSFKHDQGLTKRLPKTYVQPVEFKACVFPTQRAGRRTKQTNNTGSRSSRKPRPKQRLKENTGNGKVI
jgi:hypothetical protein